MSPYGWSSPLENVRGGTEKHTCGWEHPKLPSGLKQALISPEEQGEWIVG